MEKAFFLTVYNRPEYLGPVLDSLVGVRGWEDWHLCISIEPSDRLQEVQDLVATFLPKVHPRSVEVIVNPERYGVLHHPWVRWQELFERGFDYVLRSEDDLIHGQDVLEYHSWAAATFQHDPAVGIVTAFAADNRSHAECHRRIGLGSPLLIGTWFDRWRDVIGPTWDHDYSTGDTNTRGWDHNIHLRVFPERGLHAILPNHTKVEHIGVFGEHSTPEVFYVQPPFDVNIPQQTYREVAE